MRAPQRLLSLCCIAQTASIGAGLRPRQRGAGVLGRCVLPAAAAASRAPVASPFTVESSQARRVLRTRSLALHRAGQAEGTKRRARTHARPRSVVGTAGPSVVVCAQQQRSSSTDLTSWGAQRSRASAHHARPLTPSTGSPLPRHGLPRHGLPGHGGRRAPASVVPPVTVVVPVRRRRPRMVVGRRGPPCVVRRQVPGVAVVRVVVGVVRGRVVVLVRVAGAGRGVVGPVVVRRGRAVVQVVRRRQPSPADARFPRLTASHSREREGRPPRAPSPLRPGAARLGSIAQWPWRHRRPRARRAHLAAMPTICGTATPSSPLGRLPTSSSAHTRAMAAADMSAYTTTSMTDSTGTRGPSTACCAARSGHGSVRIAAAGRAPRRAMRPARLRANYTTTRAVTRAAWR